MVLLPSMLRSTVLATCLLLVPFVPACAEDAKESDVASADDGFTVIKPSGDITSPNAVPGTRYMEWRDLAGLKAVGALTPDLEAVATRVVDLCRCSRFSTAALLYAEDPARFAIFFPAE